MKLEVVQGPHVLFRGSNGKITAGITVRNLNAPVDAVQDRNYPYAVKWDINTCSLEQKTFPGLEDHHEAPVARCRVLEQANE